MMKKLFVALLLFFLFFSQSKATVAIPEVIIIEPISATCDQATFSELDLSNLQLRMPYTQYNGTYYDVTFNYLGVQSGKLTWQLSNASVESPDLPSACNATVRINGSIVDLNEIRVKNSNTVYSANLSLVFSGSAILLQLNDYAEVSSGVSNGGNDSGNGDGVVDLNAAGSADELKLLLAVAGSESTITLAWTSFSSDSSVSNMLYHVHLSSTEGFTPSSGTLFNTIQGQAQTELSGLTAGTKYYITIVAEDSNGTSTTSNTLAATTFTTPVVIDSSVTLENATDLQLGTATASDGQLSFTATSQSSLPNVNTLLVGETFDGGFLRWVDSVNQAETVVTMNTRDASLNEIVTTGRLNSEVLLQDISNTNTKRSLDNSRISHMSWNNELLDITQVEHAVTESSIQIEPGADGHNYRIKLGSSNKRAASNSLTVDANITFNPTLATDIDWSFFGGVNSASVDATGTLGISVTANYDFDGSVEYKPDAKRLLTKTFRAKYFIGSVPVWQVTTVTLDVEISASASSEIKASSTAAASSGFGFGSKYSNGSWSTSANPISTTNSLTANISVNGKVTGEVRLIPNIKTTFYQAIAGNISIEPFINGELAAEALSNSNLISGLSINYIQPTAFKVDLGLECYMSVALTKIFKSISLLDKTKVCGKDTITGDISYGLFSLPELSLTQDSSVGSAYVFTATAKNGTNNNFDSNSAQWTIYPEGPTISVTSNSSGSDYSSTMSFTPDSSVDQYDVFFSGYGVLGEIGRQYKQIEPGATQSCDYLSGNWNTSGSTTATISISGAGDTQNITTSASGTTVVSVSGDKVTYTFSSGSSIIGTCSSDAKSVTIDPPDSSDLQSELQAGGLQVSSVSTFESAVATVNDSNSMTLSGPGSVQIVTGSGTFILRNTYDLQFSR